MEVRRHPMLRRPPPMTAPPKPTKYCEFHKQSEHTTVECRKLKKTLHELADKCQIDCFLKKGPMSPLQGTRACAAPARDEECSTEAVANIARAEQGTRVTVPTMVFGGREAAHFAPPHNDSLVVEMKVASAIIWRILIDTGSSVNIITWDCPQKLTYAGRDIVPLVHPILGFGGQEVNPSSMIRLSLCFGDKLKVRNLEADFLVVDVPTAYNVILGCPILHKPSASSRAPSDGVH
ncbi:hypothetical protein Cgig2_019551 [Carnegiea gigantea]|uniref:Uncharacterized protein n=1 Tax=Carnegiea gigantea TaxID=171969 RepID=A0A9Q1QHP7_9CARY|nr:hypothetical protein Cgig2_019551 [Carnegiea gigantea]